MKEYQALSRYYDLFYDKETVGDEEFWRQTAEKAKDPILELGCGTGRVTFTLAAQGREITGMDNSEAMLARARTRLATQSPDVKGKVMLCKGDMAGFDLDVRFGLIIAPFRGFQHLLTPARQAACLAAVRDHLADDGVFVVTLFNPDLRLLARSGERTFDLRRTEPDSHHTILRYVRNDNDYANQVIRGTFIFERLDPEGKLVSTEYDNYTLRWTWRWEMEYLLRLSGFKVDALYGNYHRVSFPEASAELIFVCSKA